MSACLIGSISRSLLSLPSLSIGGDGDSLQFDGSSNASNAARWSGDQWDRQLASSPWIHGEHLVAARRQNSEIGLSLWVRGATFAEIQQTYEDLRDAVSQWSWVLTLSFDATSYSYNCQPADITLGFTRTHGFNSAAPVQVVAPVAPSF